MDAVIALEHGDLNLGAGTLPLLVGLPLVVSHNLIDEGSRVPVHGKLIHPHIESVLALEELEIGELCRYADLLLAVVADNVEVVLLPGVALLLLGLPRSIGLHDSVSDEPLGGDLLLPEIGALNAYSAAAQEAEHLVPDAVKVLV